VYLEGDVFAKDFFVSAIFCQTIETRKRI